MRKVEEIIEAKQLRNVKTGAMASPYGAAPWYGEDKADWVLECVGYTYRMSDGTVGACRPAAKTYEEALTVMDKINNR